MIPKSVQAILVTQRDSGKLWFFYSPGYTILLCMKLRRSLRNVSRWYSHDVKSTEQGDYFCWLESTECDTKVHPSRPRNVAGQWETLVFLSGCTIQLFMELKVSLGDVSRWYNDNLRRILLLLEPAYNAKVHPSCPRNVVGQWETLVFL